jgi:hypothetical protein
MMMREAGRGAGLVLTQSRPLPASIEIAISILNNDVHIGSAAYVCMLWETRKMHRHEGDSNIHDG